MLTQTASRQSVAPPFCVAGTKMTIARNEVARQKQDADHFVFIVSGATKLVAHATGGREQILSFHFKGDLVYVPAFPVSDFTLTALSDSELLSMSAGSVLDPRSDEPEIAIGVLLRTLVALERSRARCVLLGRATALERIASFLSEMAERIGSLNGGRCDIVLPMSRRDIADSLGLTIETVSRQFGELRDRGLLETIGRSEVRLLDLAGLRSIAGHNPRSESLANLS